MRKLPTDFNPSSRDHLKVLNDRKCIYLRQNLYEYVLYNEIQSENKKYRSEPFNVKGDILGSGGQNLGPLDISLVKEIIKEFESLKWYCKLVGETSLYITSKDKGIDVLL